MSEDPAARQEIDFADEMQQLASQVGQPKTGRPAAGPRADESELLLTMGKMVRPLALDLDSIKKDGAESRQLLTAIGKTVNTQRTVPQTLETMAAQMQRLGSVESANQKLFDALHAELKGYKDNFLFDALQKPIIRDLVTIFDDFTAVHAQTQERLAAVRGAGVNGEETAFLDRMAGNMENQLHHLLEVFQRMDVTITRTAAGSPLDMRLHRTVSVTPAASVSEDNFIARSVRPGFFWRERSVRPEDVVVLRWTPPSAAPAPDVPAASKDQPGNGAAGPMPSKPASSPSPATDDSAS